MNCPDYVPAAAWHWLSGGVVDLAKFPGAREAVPGLVGSDMAPAWRTWASQIDSDLGWHLLCDFLALLPWTYQPQNIASAERLRAQWAEFESDMQWLAQRAADLHRRALALGLEPPLSEGDLSALEHLAEAVGATEPHPVRADADYLDAARPSAQAFVQHFDARWGQNKAAHRELRRVVMSHEDVARIGAATRLAYCTADAVRRARARKPAADPHDPARGVYVLRNTGNTDPDN